MIFFQINYSELVFYFYCATKLQNFFLLPNHNLAPINQRFQSLLFQPWVTKYIFNFHEVTLWSPVLSMLLQVILCSCCTKILFHCVYSPPFIYTSVDGRSGCFHFLAIVNHPENTEVQLAVWRVDFISLIFTCRNGNAEKYGSSFFKVIF